MSDADGTMIDEESQQLESQVDAAADRASKGKGKTPKEPSGTPKGSAVPSGGGSSKLLRGFGKVGEPLSPAEARRGLYHAHIAVAGLLGSDAFEPNAERRELQERDFETTGDALADVSNHLFPQARLLLRAVAPLTFLGGEARIMRRIVEEAPDNAWWRRVHRPERPELEVVEGYGASGWRAAS